MLERQTKKTWCCTYWNRNGFTWTCRGIKAQRIKNPKEMVAVTSSNLTKCIWAIVIRGLSSSYFLALKRSFCIITTFCVLSFLRKEQSRIKSDCSELFITRLMISFLLFYPKEFYSPTTTTTLFVSVKKRI